MHGDRRGPGQRGAAHARRDGRTCAAVVPATALRAHGGRRIQAARAVARTGAGSRQHARPADLARLLAGRVGELASDPRFAPVTAVLRAERSGPAPVDSAAIDLPPLPSAQIPVATYRVQFHKDCTFDMVTRAIPYLHALGVSHLYSSP